MDETGKGEADFNTARNSFLFFVKPDILEVACKQDNMINTERDKTLFNGNQRLFKIMFSLDRNNSDIIV